MIALDESVIGLVAVAPGEFVLEQDLASGEVRVRFPEQGSAPLWKSDATAWLVLARGEEVHQEHCFDLRIGLIDGDLRVAIGVTREPEVVNPRRLSLSACLDYRTWSRGAVGEATMRFCAALSQSGRYRHLERAVEILLRPAPAYTSADLIARDLIESWAILAAQRQLTGCAGQTVLQNGLIQAQLTLTRCSLAPDVRDEIARARAAMRDAVRSEIEVAEWIGTHERHLTQLTGVIAEQTQSSLPHARQLISEVLAHWGGQRTIPGALSRSIADSTRQP